MYVVSRTKTLAWTRWLWWAFNCCLTWTFLDIVWIWNLQHDSFLMSISLLARRVIQYVSHRHGWQLRFTNLYAMPLRHCHCILTVRANPFPNVSPKPTLVDWLPMIFTHISMDELSFQFILHWRTVIYRTIFMEKMERTFVFLQVLVLGHVHTVLQICDLTFISFCYR
jgi:hypothetical protein